MKIEMYRGDRETRFFEVQAPDGEPFTEELDEIYFTVKKRAIDKKPLLQKRLSDGGICLVEDGLYELVIEPEDTDGLSFGEYVFDIELVIDGALKKTFAGSFRLLEEVTYACNERGAEA